MSNSIYTRVAAVMVLVAFVTTLALWFSGHIRDQVAAILFGITTFLMIAVTALNAGLGRPER